MKLSNLAKVLRAAGLTVVEMPGWASRGYTPPGGAALDLVEVRGILWHHTATNRAAYATSNAPTVQMTMNGRSDLAGPLCNITFGRDGTVYLVAAGLANHAGRGYAPGIPKDAGNYYLIGIEMESSGIAPWDWTADQIRVAPYLGAALERAYLQGIPEDERLQLGHKEYSSEGKIDPAGWPGDMDGLRAAINTVLNGSAAIAPQSTTTQKRIFQHMTPQEEAEVLKAARAVNRYLNAPTGDIPAKTVTAFMKEEIQRKGGTRSGTTNPRAILEYSDSNFDAAAGTTQAAK